MKLRRKVILMLGIAGAIALTGCGETKETDEQQTADVNFEKKAEVTLGASTMIDGTGVEVLEDNIVYITEGGEYVLSGILEEGVICVETEDEVMLTLEGVTITNSDGPAILGVDSKAIYINAADGSENTFSDGSTYATDEEGNDVGKGTIFSNDDLYFIGDGKITVTGNYKHTIKSDDSIFVESGILNLTAAKDGINANDIVTINGGTIVIDEAEEGIEGNTVVINGGELLVAATDDGINAASQIQINGGNSYITCTAGDAVDSNGSLEITGGLLVVHGSEMPEYGLDCDQNTINITGGTIISSGGGNSTPSDGTAAQYSILLGSANAGDKIGILDEEGNTVFAYKSEFSYSNLLVSISGLKESATYTVYTGGTITGGTEYHGYYENATYEGGTEVTTFTTDTKVISAGGTSDMMGGGNGGPGNWGGGNRPEGGQMPENGQMPGDGSMPENLELPEDVQMPENGMRPEQGEFPGGTIEQQPETGDYGIPEDGMPQMDMLQEDSETAE